MAARSRIPASPKCPAPQSPGVHTAAIPRPSSVDRQSAIDWDNWLSRTPISKHQRVVRCLSASCVMRKTAIAASSGRCTSRQPGNVEEGRDRAPSCSTSAFERCCQVVLEQRRAQVVTNVRRVCTARQLPCQVGESFSVACG